jgi:hypothetical protein
MKKKYLAGLATAVFFMGMTGMAQSISVTDMQLNGQDADAVALVLANNDNETLINALGGSFEGNDWAFIAKDDPPGGPAGTGSLGGINFSIVSTTGQSGTWDLTWSGAGFPVSIDFVVVLKGGSLNFAAFLFDNETLAAPGTNAPDDPWEITFLNNGGNIPNLSHLSLYGRDVVHQTIPEPTTMLLLGLGLVGLAGVRRKFQD